MQNLTMFSEAEELLELTGLPDRDSLWDNGFDLDDWDVGFCSDKPIKSDCWLEWRMGGYCVGYKMTEYGGKYYYLVYHG